MSDGNEHQHAADRGTDGLVGPYRQRQRPPPPAPIWRFRPVAPSPAIVRTIRTQIIPRIALAFRSAPHLKTHRPMAASDDLIKFINLLLGSDEAAASAHIEHLAAKGIPTDWILLSLLAPAARRLGDMWAKDTTDFASVTLAVGRMQSIMRHLGERCFTDAQGGAGSVLLVTMPGEQHCFGLAMVGEFFRRAGWGLSTGPFPTHNELIELVQDRWFDVVGFSVSSDRKLGELAACIRDIRRNSCNPRLGIILGGSLLLGHPELATELGADMVSVDVTTAPDQARTLVEAMRSRP